MSSRTPESEIIARSKGVEDTSILVCSKKTGNLRRVTSLENLTELGAHEEWFAGGNGGVTESTGSSGRESGNKNIRGSSNKGSSRNWEKCRSRRLRFLEATLIWVVEDPLTGVDES